MVVISLRALVCSGTVSRKCRVSSTLASAAQPCELCSSGIHRATPRKARTAPSGALCRSGSTVTGFELATMVAISACQAKGDQRVVQRGGRVAGGPGRRLAAPVEDRTGQDPVDLGGESHGPVVPRVGLVALLVHVQESHPALHRRVHVAAAGGQQGGATLADDP